MTQNSFKFAITGGMGSGKSTVAQILKNQGFKVYSCDEIYSELLKNDSFLKTLSLSFEDVLLPDGTLDRNRLSNLVFNDKEAMKKLNRITHPVIMEELLKKLNSEKFAFAEVPLLFENGYETLFDEVLVVLRNKIERIDSVVKRDKISQNEAVLRIKSQYNYDNCSFAKYYVIHNDGNLGDLTIKTLETVKKLKEKYL